jgi:ubiquinone/menaquinone biosynthesis C-methylase UbiE
VPEQTSWRLDDTAAEFYEKNFVPAIFADWATVLVDAASVDSGQNVLDVACGTGIVARTAATRVGQTGHVAGIDQSPSMIAMARRVRPDLDWRKGDAASMPFPDEGFDVVLSQAALMFFPDRVAALREMGRVLRRGGTIAVQVWGSSPGYHLTSQILEKVAGKEVAEIFRAPFLLSDPGEVKSLFVEAGLPSPKVETHQGSARFPSIEAFARTEIDGWVLAGRVDLESMLSAAREALAPFCDAVGVLRIPMEGHIFVVHKDKV